MTVGLTGQSATSDVGATGLILRYYGRLILRLVQEYSATANT